MSSTSRVVSILILVATLQPIPPAGHSLGPNHHKLKHCEAGCISKNLYKMFTIQWLQSSWCSISKSCHYHRTPIIILENDLLLMLFICWHPSSIFSAFSTVPSIVWSFPILSLSLSPPFKQGPLSHRLQSKLLELLYKQSSVAETSPLETETLPFQVRTSRWMDGWRFCLLGP